METVWSVSKLPTESVGSRRQLVANCVHTADTTKQDATKVDSFVASAVCIGFTVIKLINGFPQTKTEPTFAFPHIPSEIILKEIKSLL